MFIIYYLLFNYFCYTLFTNVRDAKKAHSAESEVQSLPCTALYELSLLQHVHYYSSTNSGCKSRVNGENGEKSFNVDKCIDNNNYNNNNGSNDNSKNNNNYDNDYTNNGNNHDSTKYSNNSDHNNSNDTRNGNSGKTVKMAETLSGSENICIPIGIVSLPSSTSFPNATEQNSYLQILGGEFNSSLKKQQIIDYSSLLHGNKKKSVKSMVVFPPVRFLVFPAIHISLPSILPLILSHTQKLNRKNQLLVINAKNTKYYEDQKSVENREIENTDLVITDSLPPPLCAFLARDLCSDLLNAVRHCIHW